jgi:hypothetical protein
MEYSGGAGSLRLDVGRSNDLAPLLDVVGDDFGEVGGRTSKDRAANVAKPGPVSGSASATFISLLSLLTISAGVFLAAAMPCQALDERF